MRPAGAAKSKGLQNEYFQIKKIAGAQKSFKLSSQVSELSVSWCELF